MENTQASLGQCRLVARGKKDGEHPGLIRTMQIGGESQEGWRTPRPH